MGKRKPVKKEKLLLAPNGLIIDAVAIDEFHGAVREHCMKELLEAAACYKYGMPALRDIAAHTTGMDGKELCSHCESMRNLARKALKKIRQ